MDWWRLIRKPFKGQFAYEWQIGPAVFFVYHNESSLGRPAYTRFHVGPFAIWHDRQWFL